MPNTSPIFPLTPNFLGVQVGSSSLGASDGSGSIGLTMSKVYQAGTSGDFLNKVIFTPSGSVSASSTAATVLRLFLTNITQGQTTATNCFLISETVAPSTTVNSQTSIGTTYTVNFNFAIPASYLVLASSAVQNNANTNWTAIALGGSY